MTKKPQGFASMTKERRTEVSRKGGIIAHQKGVAYRWTTETAKDAGRKGGRISKWGRARREDDERV